MQQTKTIIKNKTQTEVSDEQMVYRKQTKYKPTSYLKKTGTKETQGAQKTGA